MRPHRDAPPTATGVVAAGGSELRECDNPGCVMNQTVDDVLMSAARAKREVEAANASRRPPHCPGWFKDFLADRAIRKLLPHTIKAYRQDFNAIAMQVAGTADAVRNLRTDELTKVSLRSAFAGYADTHSAASVRRCWST